MKSFSVYLVIAVGILITTSSLAGAAGMTSHVVIGEQALLKMTNPGLRTLVNKNNANRQAFRSGSLFPDMVLGFLHDNYGDDYGPADTLSHGAANGTLGVFNEYLKLLQAECPDLTSNSDPTCEAKVAFFFGMTNHLVGDATWHADLIFKENGMSLLPQCPQIAPADLPASANGNPKETWHGYADSSLDICLAKALNNYPVWTGYDLKKPDLVGNTICTTGQLNAIGCFKCPSGYEQNGIYSISDDRVCRKVNFSTYVEVGTPVLGVCFVGFGPYDGKCWDCPSGYSVDLSEGITSGKRCYERDNNDTQISIYDHAAAACSGSQFWGVGCYACSSGYQYAVDTGGFTDPNYESCFKLTTSSAPPCGSVDVAAVEPVPEITSAAIDMTDYISGVPSLIDVNKLFDNPTNNVASFGTNSTVSYNLAFDAFTAMGNAATFNNDPDALRNSANATLNSKFKPEHIAPKSEFEEMATKCDWGYANVVDGDGGIDQSAASVAGTFDALWSGLSNGSLVGDTAPQLSLWRLGSFNYGVFDDGAATGCTYSSGANCANRELRYANLGAGGNLTTDTPPSSTSDLVEVTITAPQGGLSSILVSRKLQGVGESAADAIARQFIALRTPTASQAVPVQINFLFRGAAGGAKISILNAGKTVPNCSPAGITTNDPCVTSAIISGGDISMTVLAANRITPPGNYSANWSFAAGIDMLTDNDNDLVIDSYDNCPAIANTDQANADLDASGDLCDSCPLDANNDSDGDGKCADVDPCPLDTQNDGDNDGVCGSVDNCEFIANADQADADMDGTGDLCDSCPLDADNDIDGDGACANVDTYPLDPTRICSGDIDQNGTVDVVDALKALRISVGAEGSSATKLKFGDVAPLIGNVPQPDNAITAADALVILRKSIGLVSW